MTRSQPLDKRATGERMAPEGGAAQTNEPSPGGLSEADGKYLSALEQGDEQGVSLIGFSPVVYHGTPDARFEEFSSSAEKRGAKPDQIHSAFYFTDHMETAQGYRGNGYGFDDLPGNPISGDVHRMSEAEFPGGTLWWWDKDNRKQVALADFKKANRKGQFQFEFPNRFQVALHDATSTASAMRMIREWWEKNARRANYNQHIHSGLISARLITKKPRIIDADGAGFHSMTHLIRQARDQGFDSVIIRNLIDVAQNPARAVPQTTFVVFSPAQIQKANAGYLSESSAATQIITSQDSVLGSPVPGSPVSQLENRKPRGATEGGESGAGVGIKAKQSGVNARGDVPQDQPVSSEPAADKPTGFRNLHGSGRTGGFLNTDIIHHGADLIAKGIKDFGKWSVEMVKRFGSAMRDYLHGVWQQVTTRTMPKMGGGRVTVRRPEGGFIHGPQPMPRETQSRFARPEATERLYQTRADEDVKSQALAWVDSVPMERAVAQLESGALPAGMTDDVGQRAAAELLMRTSEMMSTGTEVQKLQARTLSHRMGKVWQGWMSQEAGRNLRQRAVANAELQPFAPILAAENALIDRADAVVGKRFEGGAKGGAEKAKKVADDAGKKAGENLGSKLDGENPQQRERRKGVTAKVQQSKAKMTKAQSTAESILNTLATTHADPQIWNAKGKPDPVRALYHEHLRKPMTYDEFTGRMAVLGVPENLAGTIHDAATMEIEARAEIARVIAAEKAQAREVRQVEVAENRASELIYATEERLRQGSKDLETTKTGDTINKAFRDQVKKPMAWAAFRDRLQALRVGEAVSERLFRTAERERMDQESMQNFRNDQAARELARDESKLAKMLNELRRKLAPGMTWADIFTELPSAQKERQRAIYQRLQLDERLKGLSAEERLALTNELDKAWQRERRKVFNRELEKAGVLGEKDATDRVKVQKATPRLLRMINLGMMNSEMFRESVAQEYGLKMLTAAESGHLRALAEQIQSTPDGLPRRKIAQDFINRLQDLTQSTKLEILESFWTAAVLSGWRTHTDILLGALNGIEDVGFGALVTAFRTGNADVGARAIGRMLGNLPTAVAEALHHVVTGDRSMMRNYDAEVKAAMEDGHKLMGAAGRQLLNKGGMAKAPGAFMELISRMLTAWDHINSTSTFEGAKMMALARHPELYQRALLIDHKDRVAARQRARLELTGGREPQTITEKLQEKARIKEILDETIPAEVIARATEIGRDSALQGDPTGLGWAVVEGVKAVTALPGRGVEALEKSGTSNPAAKAVIHALRVASTVSKVATGTKFVRTVAHGINRTLSYAPGLGLLRFAEGGMSGAKADILIAKQLIGTAVGLATLALFRGKDDDEEGIEGSWKGLNPQQRSQLYAQGKQPNSVWYRNAQGKIVSFNFQQWGVAGILSTVGAMEDQRRYHGHNRSDLTVLINGIVSGAMSWSDKAQLQGIQQVFGDSAYSSAGIGESLAKRLNTFAATTVGGLIPRVVKDVDQVMYPELHDSSVWWGKWAAQVPMARELATGKRVDIFGNDIKLDRTLLSRVVHVGFSDGAYHTLGLLNARDVWLPDPSSGVRVVRLTNGDRREMTPTEKDRYQRATGAGYKKFIEEHGAELLKLPVDEARKRVQRDTKPIRSLAAFQAVQR